MDETTDKELRCGLANGCEIWNGTAVAGDLGESWSAWIGFSFLPLHWWVASCSASCGLYCCPVDSAESHEKGMREREKAAGEAGFSALAPSEHGAKTSTPCQRRADRRIQGSKFK